MYKMVASCIHINKSVIKRASICLGPVIHLLSEDTTNPTCLLVKCCSARSVMSKWSVVTITVSVSWSHTSHNTQPVRQAANDQHVSPRPLSAAPCPLPPPPPPQHLCSSADNELTCRQPAITLLPLMSQPKSSCLCSSTPPDWAIIRFQFEIPAPCWVPSGCGCTCPLLAYCWLCAVLQGGQV